jgi:hypothetical protein
MKNVPFGTETLAATELRDNGSPQPIIQQGKGFPAADRKTGDSGAAAIARTGPGRAFV